MASGSLYLDELPSQKCKFRGRFNVSIFSLERLSPRGSCHLDESSMNHTLAQKYLIELLMWNASNVQNTSIKPDRRELMIRSEKYQKVIPVWPQLEATVPSDVVGRSSDCENRANEEIENKLF